MKSQVWPPKSSQLSPISPTKTLGFSPQNLYRGPNSMVCSPTLRMRFRPGANRGGSPVVAMGWNARSHGLVTWVETRTKSWPGDLDHLGVPIRKSPLGTWRSNGKIIREPLDQKITHEARQKWLISWKIHLWMGDLGVPPRLRKLPFGPKKWYPSHCPRALGLQAAHLRTQLLQVISSFIH